jgi:UDP-N-acetylmuramoyl-tripeptide--D-alanyl-D-alanine ligase
MISRVLSLYTPTYVNVLAYLLQSNEYNAYWYVKSYNSTEDFMAVAKQMRPDTTQAFKAMRALVWVLIAAFYAAAVLMFIQASWQTVLIGAGLALLAPVAAAYLLVVPLVAADWAIRKPREAKMVREATVKLHDHKAIKIGVVGSYGKTTMKEILSAVLGESAKVAATPGNYNTPVGVSRFTVGLDGDEDILIIEMGEYIPGDITKICEMAAPDYAVVTGINEQHMQRMGTLENTINTIYEISDFVDKDKILVNTDSELAVEGMDKKNVSYDSKSAGKWKATKVKAGVDGTSFTATKGKTKLDIKSSLLGEHQVGPLLAAVYLADRLGNDKKTITAGAKKTAPEGRRFNPRDLENGATFIDDTYNGNPDGFIAGIDFISGLKEKTVYITGGIIELGDDKVRIHEYLGQYLANSKIDRILLIDTPATKWMLDGFNSAETDKKVEVIPQDAEIYDNLEKFTASGEVVLMQNWQREDLFYEL